MLSFYISIHDIIVCNIVIILVEMMTGWLSVLPAVLETVTVIL